MYRTSRLGLRLQTHQDDRSLFRDLEVAIPDDEDIEEFQRSAMPYGVLWIDPMKTGPAVLLIRAALISRAPCRLVFGHSTGVTPALGLLMCLSS